MPDRQAIIMERGARYFFEHILTHDEQRRIGEIVTGICEDPWADDETKFAFPFPPADTLVYNDGEYWVIDEITGDGEITVANIGFEFEVPRSDRERDIPQ